jgi:hypothetical protein
LETCFPSFDVSWRSRLRPGVQQQSQQQDRNAAIGTHLLMCAHAILPPGAAVDGLLAAITDIFACRNVVGAK